jgi:hypothetical protein
MSLSKPAQRRSDGLPLAAKVALITGASRGTGRAIALKPAAATLPPSIAWCRTQMVQSEIAQHGSQQAAVKAWADQHKTSLADLVYKPGIRKQLQEHPMVGRKNGARRSRHFAHSGFVRTDRPP